MTDRWCETNRHVVDMAYLAGEGWAVTLWTPDDEPIVVGQKMKRADAEVTRDRVLGAVRAWASILAGEQST